MVPYLDGDDEDVECIGFLGCGHRLALTLQFAHLHPLPTENRVVTLRVPDGDKQNVAVTIFNGFVVDATQVVGSQQALQEKHTTAVITYSGRPEQPMTS